MKKWNYVILGKEEIKEQINNEEVAGLIKVLGDEKFGNEDQRKKFVDILTSLMVMKDKNARSFIKKLGDACTYLAHEMLEDEVEGDDEEMTPIPDEEFMTESLKERNKDGTGPEGKGPKTGRGEGDCEEEDEDKEEMEESYKFEFDHGNLDGFNQGHEKWEGVLKEGIKEEDSAAMFFIQEMMSSLRNTANDSDMAKDLGYEVGYRLSKTFNKLQPPYISDFVKGVIKGIK